MLGSTLNQLAPPLPHDTGAVRFTIKVNGVPIPDRIAVARIEVSHCANRIPWATIAILDGDPASQTFASSDLDTLSPGQSIEITAGYGGASQQRIFKGIIVRHSVRILQDEAPSLEVECKDEAVRLTAGRKSRYFFDKKDSEIAEELLRNVVQGEVESTRVRHREMVQYNATDWDFLLTRAEANGMLALTHAGRVHIRKPDFAQEARFALTYGSSIYEFEAEMDARDQFPQAEASVWSPSEQQVLRMRSSGSNGLPGGVRPSLLSATATNLGINLPGQAPNTDYQQVMGWDAYPLRHGGAFSSEECQTWAEAQATKSALARKRGRVKFQGVADVLPGQCLQINGVGQRHSGKVFVTAVTQEIAEGTWFTHVQFGLPMQWAAQEFSDLHEPAAGALVPAVSGLQIGVVTRLEGAAGDSERVQVRLPLVEDGGDGVWARLAQQDAGSQRGAVWRPEIGDEVVVGFLQDDPRHPIVIGALHSAANPAPIPASDDNPEKGWITRSELRLVFNDEKKSVTLKTPNGKRVTVSEDADSIEIADEHDNRIVMNRNGIVIESSRDLTLKAAANLKIEGMNIEEKANASLKMQAQGQAQFKATGDMEIGATFVRIN
jgi:uncharacterized protein involved in type VI secretion and phage assembly